MESKEYKVHFKTTAGSFNITLDRALSPNGVDRFVELVKDGHFTDMLFYRVLPGFLIQFGVAADPAQHRKWDYTLGPNGEKEWINPPLADEPNRAKFRAGSVSFAGAGENTRSCHLFIARSPSVRKFSAQDHMRRQLDLWMQGRTRGPDSATGLRSWTASAESTNTMAIRTRARCRVRS